MRHIDVVQGIVYRQADSGTEFLIMKRTPEDGGFWQAVTGTIEPGEDLSQTLKRELIEEAGLHSLVRVSDVLHQYEWAKEDISGTDNVFVVEVPADSMVNLDPTEHDDYKWLGLEDAVSMLKYDGNKSSMREAAQYILSII